MTAVQIVPVDGATGTVVAVLVAGDRQAGHLDGTGELVQPVTATVTDGGGVTVELAAQADISPAGTHWQVHFAGKRWAIAVPIMGGPYLVGDPAIQVATTAPPATWPDPTGFAPVPGPWHVIGDTGEDPYSSGWSEYAPAPLRWRIEGDKIAWDGAAVADSTITTAGTGQPSVIITFVTVVPVYGSFPVAYSGDQVSAIDRAAFFDLGGGGTSALAFLPTDCDTVALTSVVVPLASS